MPTCVKKARRLVARQNHVTIWIIGVRFVSDTVTWSRGVDIVCIKSRRKEYAHGHRSVSTGTVAFRREQATSREAADTAWS